MRSTDSLGKTLMLAKSEAGRRRRWQRMRWLDGITNSVDMSLSKLREWWWTGKPGMLQSMGSQRVRHDWPTELNWTPTPSTLNPATRPASVLAQTSSLELTSSNLVLSCPKERNHQPAPFLSAASWVSSSDLIPLFWCHSPSDTRLRFTLFF